jgi:hypothetical protein
VAGPPGTVELDVSILPQEQGGEGLLVAFTLISTLPILGVRCGRSEGKS